MMIYHGTSIKHFKARNELIKSLTDSTNDFHNYIPDYLRKTELVKDNGPKRRKVNANLKKFLTKHNIRQQDNFFEPTHEPLIVSDDTATLQSRPNKRDMNNISTSFNIDSPSKHFRPAPIDDYDSVETGPSNSK
ncbi:unnamed protein product [Rhizophagus irregularis]|nr:unnamed protein product [Rhizophagus irregularis]